MGSDPASVDGVPRRKKKNRRPDIAQLKRAWESKVWNDISNIKQDYPPIDLPPDAVDLEQLCTFDSDIKDMASQHEDPENLSCVWPFRDDIIQQRQLASQTLGQRFEALVVTNPNKPRGDRKTLPNIKEYVSSLNVPLHWKDAMRERPGIKAEYNREVFQNIEELRPRHTNVLSKLETEKLVATLMHSFVNEQLTCYIREKVARTRPKVPYKWIVKETSWKSIEPLFWGHITPKQQLALIVVRRSWRIEVLEHVEKLGIAHLWLRPETFRQITCPPNPLIEAIRTEYLDEAMKESITQDARESHLEFHCRKTTLLTILEQLDILINSITVVELSVAHVDKDELDKPFLKELKQITKAAVKYSAGAKTLEVRYYDCQKRKVGRIQRPGAQTGPKLETPADVVLRLVTQPNIKPEINRVQILGPDAHAVATQCHWIEHRRHRQTMSWNERPWRWLRFVQSVPKQVLPETRNIDMPRQVYLSDQIPEASNKNAGLVNNITATFGYALHQRIHGSTAHMARKPRAFFPVVPHPAALTSICPEENSILESEFLNFNFAPDPIKGAAYFTSAPQVRLRVPISPDTNLSQGIPKTALLHAVVPWYVHDILLPGSSVDVRMVQERLFVLDTQVQLPLREFLAASKIDLVSSHFKTPARVRILLPKSIASYAKSPRNAMKKFNESLSSNRPTTAVPYIFLGIDIQRVVEFNWRHHLVRYSSVTADSHKGERRELSLISTDFSKLGEKGGRAVAADFLQAAQDIATGEQFPWHQSHKLMNKPSTDQLAVLTHGIEAGAEPMLHETQDSQMENINDMGQLRADQFVDEREAIQHEQHPQDDQGTKGDRGLRNGGQGKDYQEGDQELEKYQDGEEEERGEEGEEAGEEDEDEEDEDEEEEEEEDEEEDEEDDDDDDDNDGDGDEEDEELDDIEKD
ncbi:hypothetical protein CDD81_7396 [Ophiocordyceps australis]|uniref:Uncharacterized protein n=1 Tax=Ophiocordyceps australis TaxID=1399860 RepID=A0A2C5YHG4_9HYPO|nr:hypothetical protein CDD81_7396 [Ophiocordyceps australis]